MLSENEREKERTRWPSQQNIVVEEARGQLYSLLPFHLHEQLQKKGLGPEMYRCRGIKNNFWSSAEKTDSLSTHITQKKPNWVTT